MCVCVGVVLRTRMEDEVEGRRKDRTCDCQMPSAKSKNAQVFQAETKIPLESHSHQQLHSFFPSLADAPMLILLGPLLVVQDLTHLLPLVVPSFLGGMACDKWSQKYAIGTVTE